MKTHKSHHIFTYLGLLALLFVLVFGVHYFQSNYSFEDMATLDNSQDYEEGRDTVNPFVTNIYAETETPDSWRAFSSEKISFKYPREYQLHINGMSDFSITAPYVKNISCDDIDDEQERAMCLRPYLSPNISIELGTENTNPFIEKVTSVRIAGVDWKRSLYQDEFGGTVWFGSDDAESIIVSYHFTDVSGGMLFNSLHSQYGQQYQLTQSEQEKLVRSIIATINIQ